MEIDEIKEEWLEDSFYGMSYPIIAENYVIPLLQRIEELEAKFPCGHRKVDWDDSYGNCVACQMKEYADKYDDQLGLHNKIEKLETNLIKLKEAVKKMRMVSYGGPVEQQTFITPAWAMHDLLAVLDELEGK